MNRTELLLWARRICAQRSADAHVMLEINPSATVEDAQAAYHKLARVAHPDLHRNGATPDELELITTAFSLVAASYHAFRTQQMQTTRMTAIKLPPKAQTTELKKVTTDDNPPAPPPAQTAALVPERPSQSPPNMAPRALTFYRKAEQSLRRGDLPAAVLHLKMAVGADPQSAFLRQAIKEVESELGKKPFG